MIAYALLACTWVGAVVILVAAVIGLLEGALFAADKLIHALGLWPMFYQSMRICYRLRRGLPAVAEERFCGYTIREAVERSLKCGGSGQEWLRAWWNADLTETDPPPEEW